jgi:hypothetical protein
MLATERPKTIEDINELRIDLREQLHGKARMHLDDLCGLAMMALRLKQYVDYLGEAALRNIELTHNQPMVTATVTCNDTGAAFGQHLNQDQLKQIYEAAHNGLQIGALANDGYSSRENAIRYYLNNIITVFHQTPQDFYAVKTRAKRRKKYIFATVWAFFGAMAITALYGLYLDISLFNKATAFAVALLLLYQAVKEFKNDQ